MKERENSAERGENKLVPEVWLKRDNDRRKA